MLDLYNGILSVDLLTPGGKEFSKLIQLLVFYKQLFFWLCHSEVPFSNKEGPAEFGQGVVGRAEDAGVETEALCLIPLCHL